MDALLAAALEEVAVEGPSGCLLSHLWTLLESSSTAVHHLPLDDMVKQACWNHLCLSPIIHIVVSNPLPGSHAFLPENSNRQQIASSVPLHSRRGQTGLYVLPGNHSSIQSFKEAESLGGKGVTLLASQSAQDSVLGLYDHGLGDYGLNHVMRETLQRLAKARAKGSVQADLARALGVHNNNYFYVLKNLETRGLIVRNILLMQSQATLQAKQTNTVHLARYTPEVALGSTQRFVTPHQQMSGLSSWTELEGEENGSSLTIHDDLPAMREICNLLEEAQGKVLVRSELKVKLSYRKVQGHRAWRRLQKRLETAGLVEVFKANVDGKVIDCIKLIRPFDGTLKPKETIVDNWDTTELVLELPLERQIWAMVHQAGQEGLLITDVWKRMGIDGKRHSHLVANLVQQGCVVTEVDCVNRSTIYRLRSASIENVGKPKGTPNVDDVSNQQLEETETGDKAIKDVSNRTNVPVAGALLLPSLPGKTQSLSGKTVSEKEEAGQIVCFEGTGAVTGKDDSLVLSEPRPQRVRRRTNFPMNKNRQQQHEQLALNVLQERKFILRYELRALLQAQQPAHAQNCQLDRKTVMRMLARLQDQGLVKLVKIFVPGVSNGGKVRAVELLLLPSQQLTPDLLQEVHKRSRRLEQDNRPGLKPSQPVGEGDTAMPVLSGLQRMPGPREVDRMNSVKDRELRLSAVDPFGALQKNGYVVARMVRARLWHRFVWTYVASSKEAASNGSLRFHVERALLAMPLQLYLQVIGTQTNVEDILKRNGHECLLSDLSPVDRSLLLDFRTNSGISQLLDMLCRLKLLRLEIGSMSQRKPERSHVVDMAVLEYVLERHPYIEEPAENETVRRIVFDLATEEGMSSYWSTLEFVYAKIDQKQARSAFPGNVARELYSVRAWCSDRVMTWRQRRKLVHFLQALPPNCKNHAVECAAIARDVGLSLNQVVSMMYARNFRMRLQTLQNKPMLTSASERRRKVGKGESGEAVVAKRVAEAVERERDPLHVQAYKRQKYQADREAEKVKEKEKEKEREKEREKAKEKLKENAVSESYLRLEGDPDYCHGEVKHVVKQRAKRVLWNETLDRSLVMHYLSFRARYPRMQWHRQKGLPSTPDACRRRIAALRMDVRTRQAMGALLGLLMRRYTHWESWRQKKIGGKKGDRDPPFDSQTEAGSAEGNSGKTGRAEGGQQGTEGRQEEEGNGGDSTARVDEEGDGRIGSSGGGAGGTMGSSGNGIIGNVLLDEEQKFAKWDGGWKWNDVGHPQVANSLSNVMSAWASVRPWVSRPARRKRPGTVVARKPIYSVEKFPEKEKEKEKDSDKEKDKEEGKVGEKEKENVPEGPVENTGLGPVGRVPAAPVVPKKDLPGQGGVVRKATEVTVRKSLKAASAVELIKALLLNSTSDGQYSELLVAALRGLGDENVIAAFEYLREREIVVSGQGGRPFAVSQKLEEMALCLKSPGSDAHHCLEWIAENAGQILHGWLLVPSEQKSGHLLQILTHLASEEIRAVPFLPSVGVGESLEGPQRRGFRGEHLGRRIRGFPNILVGIQRQVMGLGALVALGTNTDEDEREEEGGKEGDESQEKIDSLKDKAGGLAAVLEDPGEGSGTVKEASCAQERGERLQKSDRTQEGRDRKDEDEEDVGELDVLVEGHEEDEEDAIEEEVGEGGEKDSFALDEAFKSIMESGERGLSLDELAKKNCYSEISNEGFEGIVKKLVARNKIKKVNAFDHVRFLAEKHADCFFLLPRSLPSTLEGNSYSRRGSTRLGHALPLGSSKQVTSERVSGTSFGPMGSALEGSSPYREVMVQREKDGRIPLEGNHFETITEARKEDKEKEKEKDLSELVPFRPWLSWDGEIHGPFLEGILRCILRTVLFKPGISEEQLINTVDMVTPQSCRDLLEVLQLEGSLWVRTVVQPKPKRPFWLKDSSGSKPKKNVHYFIRPSALHRL